MIYYLSLLFLYGSFILLVFFFTHIKSTNKSQTKKNDDLTIENIFQRQKIARLMSKIVYLDKTIEGFEINDNRHSKTIRELMRKNITHIKKIEELIRDNAFIADKNKCFNDTSNGQVNLLKQCYY